MDIISRREKERQMREEDIVNAAELVFSTLGYNKTSMEEIAKEAQFTRKTIYQYFTDKDDLCLEVVTRKFKQLLIYLMESIKVGNNGFEKLQNLSYAYYKFYQDFPNTFNLMNYVGYIKSDKENSSRREEFNRVSGLLSQEVANVISEGKLDGSIRQDLDTMNLTYSAEYIISGFFHMLSISGATFTSHFSLNKEDFIKFNMNLICDAFRAKSDSDA
ncbi:TetR/AcrR family transcriptional regulator [Clostridium sp.]|uniref:TetR/AcrR family transcriptional regulator n=1 Tax=Clostridium sp. TaxID=1506 RepID=UPI0026110E36|nr:TetR/AcrR family transcriptional regulator [Clostridium sp.]